MEWLVAVVTVCAAVVTIVWFVKDIRKENSKILKAILDAQQRALEIQQEEAHILAKIEEGQRKGFGILEQTLAKIEEGQRKGFETLAQLLVKAGVR
jgi:predicted small secreted protein